MAKSVSVIVTDDLDGSKNAETVSFSFGGVTYEVDLASKNRARLEKALAPFIEAGRRVPGGGGRRGGASRQGSPSVDRVIARRAHGGYLSGCLPRRPVMSRACP
jgi:hypothetical protein